MAVSNFSLLLESQTRGTAEVSKLEQALVRLMDTADRTAKRTEDATKKAAGSAEKRTAQLKEQAQNLRAAIANPLDAAAEAAEEFALSFGRAGVVASGVAVGVTAAAAGIFKLADATQDLAEQQTNAAAILGLSIKDYGLFSQAAKNASVDSAALVGTIRGLSKALSDNTDEGKKAKQALADIGVSNPDASNTKVLFLEIADALGRIQNPAERADAAIKILGRGGVQLLPLFNGNLRETIDQLDRLGVGFDDISANKANKFGDQLDILGTRIDVLKKKAGLLAIDLINLFNIRSLKTPGEKEKELDDAQQLARDTLTLNYARRNNLEILLSTSELEKAIPTGPGPGLSGGQLDASLRKSNSDAIQRFLNERDDQARLTRAQQELADAVQAGNLASVKLAQAKIDGLKQRIEAAAKEKAEREKLATFEAGSVNLLSRSGSAPSLLSPRDRLLRGDAIGGSLVIDTGAIAEANAGAQSAAAAQQSARLSGISDRDRLDRSRQVAALQQTIDLQVQLVEALAGPGGEVDAVQRATSIRLAGLEQLKQLGADAFEIELKQREAIADRDLRILDLRKQQREEGRRTAESLFDAAVSGGQGLRSFLLSQTLSIPRTIAGNLGSELGGLTGRFSLGLGGLPGRLLQGTPFGADPMKNATDLNTQATVQNTAAIAALSSAMGIPALAGPGGSFGSILGGVTSNPMIFNAVGGGRTGSHWGNRNLDIAMMYGLTPRMSGLQRGIGIGGTLAAGAFGAYSGFSAGGAQGLLTGTSSLAGATAGLLPLLGVSGPAAPILGAVALGLGLGSALFGDPKRRRADELSREAESRRFTEPAGRDYVSDIYGRQIDYDYQGRMRTQTVVNVTYNISAIDGPSVSEFFLNHGPELAEGITRVIQSGNGEDVLGAIQQATA